MNAISSSDQRKFAASLFRQALANTSVAAAFARHLRLEDRRLHADGHTYDLALYEEVVTVAIGKAAAPMFDAFDALLSANIPHRAVVIAPFAPQRASDRVMFIPGSHPEPGASALLAAHAALDLLHSAAPKALVLFLISGGASAMCELPLEESVPLSDVVALHRLLIGCGASITEINSVRKHLSQVKGGRLALAAGMRDKLTLLISDVPSGALDALGSGPSLPDASTVDDCNDILTRYELVEKLPASWRNILRSGLPETPKPSDPAFLTARTIMLLDNAAVLRELDMLASSHGFHVVIDNTCDDWDYADAAEYLLGRMRDLLTQRPDRICLLSGGEVTVKLPGSPGVGGRNQQFVLRCAASGIPDGVTVLSAGTDGIDGNSSAAGAVADASTCGRAQAAGLSLEDHLARFDAFPLFQRLGDTILTGPTGNNLRDLRILLSDAR